MKFVPMQSAFKMKQFEVFHHRSSMKVGTDALLLGSWLSWQNPTEILDVGCGSGIISLMLAQRFPAAQVTAIDIDSESVLEARLNFKNSPFSERLCARETDYNQLKIEKLYDAVVCNPPFFSQSLHAPKKSRNLARHQVTFNISGYLTKMYQVTTKEASLSVIFPTEDLDIWLEEARRVNWFPQHITEVRHTKDHDAKRILMTLSKYEIVYGKSELILKNNETFTDEYINLVRDFLLNF